MTESTPAVSAWNIANALTVLRLVLVPVFLVLLFHNDGHDDVWRVLAFVVFAVASVTDRVDGEIARRRGIVTDFGKIADPIADKALIGAALVGLSLLGELAVVGHGGGARARDRRDAAAVLRHPARRHAGQPRRQGQDDAAGRRHRAARAAARRRAALGGPADHVRRRGGHRRHRGRLRGPRRATAPHQRAHRAQAGPARRAAVTPGVGPGGARAAAGPARDARGRGVADRRCARGGGGRGARGVGDVPGRGGRLRHRAEVRAARRGRRAAGPAAGRSTRDVAVAMAAGVRQRLRGDLGARDDRGRRPGPAGRAPARGVLRGGGRAGRHPGRGPGAGRRPGCGAGGGRRRRARAAPCRAHGRGTHRDDYSVTLGTRRPTGYGGDRYQPGPRRRRCPMILLRRLLGDVLREHRREQGRTLREVSAAARVSLGYLSEVERGQKEASSELLGSICEALEVPLSEVLRDVSDNLALAEALPELPQVPRCRSPRPPRCTSPTWPHRRSPSGYETHSVRPSTPRQRGCGRAFVRLGARRRQRGWQRGHQNDSRW